VLYFSLCVFACLCKNALLLVCSCLPFTLDAFVYFHRTYGTFRNRSGLERDFLLESNYNRARGMRGNRGCRVGVGLFFLQPGSSRVSQSVRRAPYPYATRRERGGNAREAAAAGGVHAAAAAAAAAVATATACACEPVSTPRGERLTDPVLVHTTGGQPATGSRRRRRGACLLRCPCGVRAPSPPFVLSIQDPVANLSNGPEAAVATSIIPGSVQTLDSDHHHTTTTTRASS
jgi:hypothetical protein